MNDPILYKLFLYWKSKRDENGFASKASIDPVEIPDLLPYLTIIESYDNHERFRYRLVGTVVAQGIDPTGQFLDEALPDTPYRRHKQSLLKEAIGRAEGLLTEYRYSNGPSSIRRLLLPLMGRNRNVRYLITGQISQNNSDESLSAWQANPAGIEKVMHGDPAELFRQ
ncbi:PAS domain-containing protein [Kiloniella sp. b19]|uniref:PAS domain-containing protein n=1 Tax=Kiloniella sp. GXU_MW_B19 TaxID=3141326 RepID=UPI0031DE7053